MIFDNKSIVRTTVQIYCLELNWGEFTDYITLKNMIVPDSETRDYHVTNYCIKMILGP